MTDNSREIPLLYFPSSGLNPVALKSLRDGLLETIDVLNGKSKRGLFIGKEMPIVELYFDDKGEPLDESSIYHYCTTTPSDALAMFTGFRLHHCITDELVLMGSILPLGAGVDILNALGYGKHHSPLLHMRYIVNNHSSIIMITWDFDNSRECTHVSDFGDYKVDTVLPVNFNMFSKTTILKVATND